MQCSLLFNNIKKKEYTIFIKINLHYVHIDILWILKNPCGIEPFS